MIKPRTHFDSECIHNHLFEADSPSEYLRGNWTVLRAAFFAQIYAWQAPIATLRISGMLTWNAEDTSLFGSLQIDIYSFNIYTLGMRDWKHDPLPGHRGFHYTTCRCPSTLRIDKKIENTQVCRWYLKDLSGSNSLGCYSYFLAFAEAHWF